MMMVTMRKRPTIQRVTFAAVIILFLLYSYSKNLFDVNEVFRFNEYKNAYNLSLSQFNSPEPGGNVIVTNSQKNNGTISASKEKLTVASALDYKTSPLLLNGSGYTDAASYSAILTNTNITAIQDEENLFIRSSAQFDMLRRHWKIWPRRPSCQNYDVYFSVPHSLPICALVSYPGSGNTWFRYMTEAASGIFTSSIYNDAQLFLWGYLGELEDVAAGTTILQKTHSGGADEVRMFNRSGILIVRNPYRAILSYHNFLFAGHKLYASITNYRRKDWNSFVVLQLRVWLKIVISWVKDSRRLLVVYYENLHHDPLKEIRRVLKYLNVPADEERLRCLKENLGVSLKRKDQNFPATLQIFSNKTRDKMDRGIRYATFLLKKHGHSSPPLDLYEFYNGTIPTKVTFVPCYQYETLIECDARVDELNIITSLNRDSDAVDARLRGRLHPLPSRSVSRLTNEDGTQDEKEENDVMKNDSPVKKIDFKGSIVNQVESSAMKFISKILEAVTQNPVKRILQSQKQTGNHDNDSLILGLGEAY